MRSALVRARVALWKRTLRRPVGRMFHFDLIASTGNFRSLSWAGTPIWQNPMDLWTVQETIFEVRPELLIEIGTDQGGSALFYAHLMDLMDNGRVITIDIAKRHQLSHPRVEFIHGSSTDPEVVDTARSEASRVDGPVMVILDGNHDRDHVAKELELYGPLVTPESLMLSQDGIIDQMGIFRDSRPGPLEANRDFLARHPEFEYDRARNERFSLTQHPLGWMRRAS
jgi:cephalosporin hydroxylase